MRAFNVLRLPLWSLPHVGEGLPAGRTIHKFGCLGWCGFGTLKELQTRTELLVDADLHSVDEIRQAISRLEDEAGVVQTKIFAAPARKDNKKWGRLMQETGITFCPVKRSTEVNHAKEPNDEAMTSAIQELVGDSSVNRIALLTSDLGFTDTILKATAAGAKVTVVTPEYCCSAIRRYKELGVELVQLEAQTERGSRVRAILHNDGEGSVELAERYKSIEYTKLDQVTGLLGDLGYMNTGKFLAPACAKFWFAHGLGPLVVFPEQLGTLAVQEVISQPSLVRSWKRYDHDLAFFTPTLGLVKSGCEPYGNPLARSIFRAGGPFMLKDSPNLVSTALRRLGYLDHVLNTDEAEAMFSFVNVSTNKVLLKKVGMLPDQNDSSGDVQEKLRAAFLSHASGCQWKKLGDGHERIQQILLREQLLAKSQVGCSPEGMLDAMKVYIQKYRLAPKKTFNALSCMIARNSNQNPSQRPLIEWKL